jgi:hypothetical protein
MRFRNPAKFDGKKLGRSCPLRILLSIASCPSLKLGAFFTFLPLLSLSIASCGKNEQESTSMPPNPEAFEAKKQEAWKKARDKRLARELDFEKSELARLEAEQKALGEQLIRELANSHIRRIEKQQNDAARETQVDQTRPVQMTDDQKLAAYETHGITGVPAEEAKEIIRKARLEGSAWRSNLEIESEGKGYATVQDFAMRITQMPTLVRDEIVNSAKREHAGDWSRISDEVTRQAEAWTTLEEWRKTKVPGLTQSQSASALSAAISRWPGDWEMALRSVNVEARKLVR